MIQFEESNAREIRTLARRCKFLDSVPREEVTFSGPDGPIPELCHEMDSLGPAVSKLQGKTERRLLLHPTAANFSSFRSPPAPHRSPQCILLALVRSSTYFYLHRPNRLARGFTAPNIPRASDTLGPAMIHLCRGYRTARSLPSSSPALFLLHSIFSSIFSLLPFSFLPLYFPSFAPHTSPPIRSFSLSTVLHHPSIPFAPFFLRSRTLNLPILDFFHRQLFSRSLSLFFISNRSSIVRSPPLPFRILLSLSSATRDTRRFYRGKPAI